MSPKKEVSSLSDLSLRSTRNFIIAICDKLLEEELVPSEYNALVNQIRSQLYDITARYLHDAIADHCLCALNKWYESNIGRYSTLRNGEELSTRCETVVRHLVAVVPNQQLKQIHKKELSKPVASALLQFLNQMSNLEVLDCNHFYMAVNYSVVSLEQNIVNSCQSFSNLTAFLALNGCNDRIVAAICVNCKAVSEIVVSSNNVTDLCIESLVTCQKLEKVGLGSTAVSNQGFFKLLTEARSEKLNDFGVCADMNELLDLLEESGTPLRPYRWKCLIYHNVRDEAHLRMACKHFPHFKKLITTSNHDIFCPDLACLTEITSLTEITVSYNNNITTNLSRFVAIRGALITSLSFGWHIEAHINSILNICIACPNLEELIVSRGDYFSEFLYGPEVEDNEHPSVIVLPESFSSLKRLSFHGHISIHFPKFILCHAPNIEHLEIGPFSTITDELFEYVFQSNPLSQLKKLEIHYEINGISARMLKLLIERCEKLSHVDNFWSPPATLTDEEIGNVKNFIAANNYDLVIW